MIKKHQPSVLTGNNYARMMIYLSNQCYFPFRKKIIGPTEDNHV